MTQYWDIPQDIKTSWVHLAERLAKLAEGHGGHTMTFTIIVRGGVVTDILEPVYRKREPRGSIRDDLLPGKNWWTVIRRLQSVGNGRACLVEMDIDLDGKDHPVTWREPTVRPTARK